MRGTSERHAPMLVVPFVYVTIEPKPGRSATAPPVGGEPARAVDASERHGIAIAPRQRVGPGRSQHATPAAGAFRHSTAINGALYQSLVSSWNAAGGHHMTVGSDPEGTSCHDLHLNKCANGGSAAARVRNDDPEPFEPGRSLDCPGAGPSGTTDGCGAARACARRKRRRRPLVVAARRRGLDCAQRPRAVDEFGASYRAAGGLRGSRSDRAAAADAMAGAAGRL